MEVIQVVLDKEEWQLFQKKNKKKNYGTHLKKEEFMQQQVIKLIFYLKLIIKIWVQKLIKVEIDQLKFKYPQ